MAYISCTFSTMYKTSSMVTEYISINCLIRILFCCHYCCTNKVFPSVPSQCFVMLLLLFYMPVSFFSVDPILHMSNIPCVPWTISLFNSLRVRHYLFLIYVVSTGSCTCQLYSTAGKWKWGNMKWQKIRDLQWWIYFPWSRTAFPNRFNMKQEPLK